jgi:hypothetical protein
MLRHRTAFAVLAFALIAAPVSGKDLAAKNGGDAAPAAEAGTEEMPTDWAFYVPPTDGSFSTWAETPPEIGLVKRIFQLMYTEECSWALGGAGEQEPEVYDLSFRYDYETDADPERLVKLYRFFCNAGAYNEVAIYMTWQADWGLRPVSFVEPSLDIKYVNDDSLEGGVESIRIIGYQGVLTLVNSWYDPATQTITSASKWRGLADASSSGVHVFDEGSFVLQRYDVDASYDGEINPFTILDTSSAQPVELVPVEVE